MSPNEPHDEARESGPRGASMGDRDPDAPRVSVLETKVPPPVVAVVCGALMWAVARATPAVPLPPGPLDVAGLTLAAAGLAVEAAGIERFWAARTSANPVRPGDASALVTTGVYRYTRNPMYVGDALILAGWAAHLGNAFALAGIWAFVAHIGRFQIPAEERAMTGLFGDEYAQFKLRVRRWV